ncbi:MAG TPA: hypothetical protein VFW87_03480 [Pirellulales bacterium]|nr:hypothetical protein [Pirellulales bacterium]
MDRMLTAEQQALFEHELLAHIAGALRTTIDWTLRTQDASSRLPSLRFIAQSFVRHLDHILDLEERDGYMPGVDSRRHADLRQRVWQLRRDHDYFRAELAASVERLESAASSDYLTIGEVCHAMLALLDGINEHNQHELEIIELARERDQRDQLLGML